MKITLPKPPSINHIYGFTSRGGFARSYITKEGTAWFMEAGLLLKLAWKSSPLIITPFQIEIKLFTARHQDVDNILKPILDLLQKNNVIKNDSLVVKLCIEKIKCKVNEQRIELVLMPCN